MAEKCDVMVSFVESDLDLAEFLVGEFKKNNISVWFTSSDDTDIERQRAQAVVNCKVFVYIVSEVSAVSQMCKDELSLAYISNSYIFPVAKKRFPKLAPHLDAGMKLMLAKINWSFFVKPEERETNIKPLVDRIKEDIQSYQSISLDEANEISSLEGAMNRHLDNAFIDELNDDDIQEANNIVQFWDRHFQNINEVTWDEFRESLLNDYRDQLAELLGDDRVNWLMQLFYRDIFERKQDLKKEAFDRFIGKVKKGSLSSDIFYSRLTDYAIGNQAIRDVFDMDSTVRLTAIQNLGSYQTPSVMNALMNLLTDSDPNVRAVACLALVKTGSRSSRIADKLIAMLDDEDRLVRESCCLSLAHMRATQAVPHIANVWRNEPIKNVREAAELALKRIGGDEAEETVKLTKVLSEEMSSLRGSKK